MIGNVETTISTLRDAAQAMRLVTVPITDEVRAIETAIQALQAAKCERLGDMDETKAHEADGASSISTWARRELQQEAGRTRQMVAARRTFRDLPSVCEAARRGGISFEHVLSFTYALKHVGADETRKLEGTLLDWARDLAPSELHSRVRDLRDALHPDDLDEKLRKAMDRRDLSLSKTFEGWHLTGFLDIETGAKLKTILTNLSVPREAGDDRTASQRRMDALDQICTTVLDDGLPSDNCIRPHVSVVVQADTVRNHVSGEARRPGSGEAATERDEGARPGQHLLCDAEITPVLIERIGPNVKVLDVGDTRRLATDKQAKAISFRQRGTCASPGDAAIVGRSPTAGQQRSCDRARRRSAPRLHLLVHAEKLHIDGTYGTGYTFTTGRGSPLHQRAGGAGWLHWLGWIPCAC